LDTGKRSDLFPFWAALPTEGEKGQQIMKVEKKARGEKKRREIRKKNNGGERKI